MPEEMLEFIFTYHAPTEEQRAAHSASNKIIFDAVKELEKLMPNGPGKTVAIRKLAEARQAVHAAIALEGKF